MLDEPGRMRAGDRAPNIEGVHKTRPFCVRVVRNRARPKISRLEVTVQEETHINSELYPKRVSAKETIQPNQLKQKGQGKVKEPGQQPEADHNDNLVAVLGPISPPATIQSVNTPQFLRLAQSQPAALGVDLPVLWC